MIDQSESSQDAMLKRNVGWMSLASLTFCNVVGSGWLFASYYAARDAGPSALIAWLICGAAMVPVVLTYVELGITRPVDGGVVRWPAIVCGPFCGTMIGWVVFMQAAVSNPSEASGMLQYAAHWWPWLVTGNSLSHVGVLLAIALLVVFTILNWFGVLLLARVTNLITVFKILVPLITVGLMIASGFHASNVAVGGGFAPYGQGAILTTIISAGLVYSFGGLQIGPNLAGEARRPERDVPLGTLVGIGGAFVLYLLLQTTFLGVVPQHMLAAVGWHGIDFSSPFVNLAILLNMGWLANLLLIDSLVSPGGSLLAGVGYYGRATYGLGQSHLFPAWAGKVHRGSGIPRNALLLNLAAAIVFVVLFRSWQGLVSTMGMLYAMGYAVIAVAAGANHLDPRLRKRRWLKGVVVAAPCAFCVSVILMYWAGWDQVRTAVALFLVSLPVFAILSRRYRTLRTFESIRYGVWLLALPLMLAGWSYIGSFGPGKWISAPWDSIMVALWSALMYAWARQSAGRWLRLSVTDHPAAVGGLDRAQS